MTFAAIALAATVTSGAIAPAPLQAQPATDSLLGEFGLLVVPCAFSDAPPADVAPADLAIVMGDVFPGGGAYVREASRGRATLAARVTPWVTVARPLGDFITNGQIALPGSFGDLTARDRALGNACASAALAAQPSLSLNGVKVIQIQLPVLIDRSYNATGIVDVTAGGTTHLVRLTIMSRAHARSSGEQLRRLFRALEIPNAAQPDSRWTIMGDADHGFEPSADIRFGTFPSALEQDRLGWLVSAEVRSPRPALDTIELIAAGVAGDGVRVISIPPMLLEARLQSATFERAVPFNGVIAYQRSVMSGAGPPPLVLRDGSTDVNGLGSRFDVGDSLRFPEPFVSTFNTFKVIERTPRGFRVATVFRDPGPPQVTLPATAVLQTGRPLSISGATGLPPFRVTTTGVLPPGLAFAPDGALLAGTPTTTGRFDARVIFEDALGRRDSLAVSYDVRGPQFVHPPLVRTTPVGRERIDTLARYRIGPGTFGASRFEVLNAPPGSVLIADSSSDTLASYLLRWTPQSSEPRVITVRSIDLPRTWTVTFDPGGQATLQLVSDSVRPAVFEQTPYTDSLQVVENGLATDATWRVVSGRLPVGFQLSPSGRITGATTDTGRIVAVLEAAIAADSLRQAFVWDIVPAFTGSPDLGPDTLAINALFVDTLQLAARNGGLQWSVSSGALPDGVRLDTIAGRLIGTPVRAQPFAVTLRAQAGLAVRDYVRTGIVLRRPLAGAWSRADSTLQQGEAFVDTLDFRFGDLSLIGVVAQSLPAGMTFDAQRRILSGVPRDEGSQTAQFSTVQSGILESFTREYAVRPLTAIPSDTTSRFRVGLALDTRLPLAPAPLASDGLTIAVVDGRLPAGTTLDADGRLRGAPQELGQDSARVRITLTRAGTSYSSDSWFRWQTFTTALAVSPLLDALGGGASIPSGDIAELDALGNRNGRFDIGDLLLYLVRIGILPPNATPAMMRSMVQP